MSVSSHRRSRAKNNPPKATPQSYPPSCSVGLSGLSRQHLWQMRCHGISIALSGALEIRLYLYLRRYRLSRRWMGRGEYPSIDAQLLLVCICIWISHTPWTVDPWACGGEPKPMRRLSRVWQHNSEPERGCALLRVAHWTEPDKRLDHVRGTQFSPWSAASEVLGQNIPRSLNVPSNFQTRPPSFPFQRCSSTSQ
jgi:hypothetical protein